MGLFRAEELNKISTKVKQKKDEEMQLLLIEKLAPIMERMKYAADLGDFYYDFSWKEPDIPIMNLVWELQRLGYEVQFQTRCLDNFMVRVLWDKVKDE